MSATHQVHLDTGAEIQNVCVDWQMSTMYVVPVVRSNTVRAPQSAAQRAARDERSSECDPVGVAACSCVLLCAFVQRCAVLCIAVNYCSLSRIAVLFRAPFRIIVHCCVLCIFVRLRVYSAQQNAVSYCCYSKRAGI